MEVGDSTYGLADQGGGAHFQKRDQRVSNYRGVTLLILPGKVYFRVLERRLRSNLSFRRNNVEQWIPLLAHYSTIVPIMSIFVILC